MVTIAASHAWAVSTLRWRSWMCHLLTVDAHLGVAARLRYLDKGVELLPPSRSSSRPGCRQARSTSGGSTAGLRITVVANPEVTIAPLALRNQMSCQWNVLGPLKGACQQYPWHSSRLTRCRSLHRRVSRSFWRGRFLSRAGSQSWCASWRPLPGRFLWGRIYWLGDGAPCSTRVQTSGNFMSGPWTGRGGSRWPTPKGSRHHHFGESTVYETCLRL